VCVRLCLCVGRGFKIVEFEFEFELSVELRNSTVTPRRVNSNSNSNSTLNSMKFETRVGHTGDLCKNGGTNPDAVWGPSRCVSILVGLAGLSASKQWGSRDDRSLAPEKP